ncbi:hypothetical protein CGRA01v4_12182 [Colletotrichum graminicola]|uniref:Uncharacterized protein n=1 Tax=Colletotrichum graminicola (strain M1.001 / M2 / FGSC 10212) TaxID=645133 RepID=E3QTC9_COLGM|nr:uncharacterized protein GLRG_09261 [Colletotrichum graminicola M1.001]EFQ34117.1 hypothetical protein GLRG_09261 [Colletotrichum graminicola M1.001]WDK20893.1 hypothetical protein CGRA01v4_12182 [Colletotrichum graminicola]
MAGYGRHHDRAGFTSHSQRARRDLDKQLTDAAIGDNDEFTNSLPKWPRLADTALDQPDYLALKLSHKAYTVGWVCALPLEMAAAAAMLDETHEPLAMNPSDSNVYTFGRIGPHDIVIACLPLGQYGTNSAAVVANNMRWSFPSIYIRLMVGIGGGVPGKVDIRLGDVVVSSPTGTSSGVVQYDFGKAVHDGRFEYTGTLNKPPQSLLAAVSKLRANHERRPNQIPAILADMKMRNPDMTDYLHQSMDEDRLFQAFYEHTGGDTCDDCDVSMIVERDPRPAAATPKIHYGIIASGNQVMKYAQTRDRLAKDLGVICFEMEAAGLMDNFPCLVIRGICDYSDSHKAKRWQRYAAATAAAYAKELLYLVTPHDDLMGQTPVPHNDQSSPPADHNKKLLDSLKLDHPSPPADHKKKLLDSLKFSQIGKRQENIKAAHAETCKWLVEHPDYAAWMDRQKYSQHHGFLWIKGKPGTGKSTVMNYAFTRAKESKGEQKFLISFFFNARGEGLEKTTLGMYRALLHQLLESMPDLQTLLDDPDLRHLSQSEAKEWGLDQLRNLFRSAVRRLGQRRLTCFIDALDECDDHEVSDMVKCFEDLGQYAVQHDIRFYVCLSSRHYPYIDIFYGQKLVLEDQIGHGKDLEDYVRSELRAGSGRKSEQVIAEILRKASGVFMWVVLVVDILNKEYRKGRLFAVEKRLNDIPSELSKLFQDILTRDQEDMGDLVLCIQLLLYSQRPLKREEYYFALASCLEPDTFAEWDPEDITHEFMDRLIVSSSKGLAEATRSDDKTVQFIHESVRDFLLKDNGLRTLWPDMADNFEGLSHERLKQCCHTYSTQVNISAYLPEDKFLLKTSEKNAQSWRDQVAERFPFLEYATNQALHHAEAAAIHGISQEKFLKGFMVDPWIQMNNLFERVMVRRHLPASTSILYITAAKGLSMLVETSLGLNLDVDTVGGRYGYPLLAAIIADHVDAAHILLNCIAKKAQQGKSGANSDLEYRHGVYTISPSLNYAIPGGRTALYFAARSRDISIAKRLLELGASCICHTGLVSFSPLVCAMENDNLAFVRCYLHERSKSRSSLSRVPGPSRLASSDEKHGGESRLLGLDEDTVPSPRDDSQTRILASKRCEEDASLALTIAAGTGNIEIARLLLKSGADIQTRARWGDTPLEIAYKNSKWAVVQFLLENGAKLESADRFGCTPLQGACERGNLAAVKLLLEAGANFHIRDKRRRTLLHLACSKDDLETASFLIEAGADVQATDTNGQTPLFYTAREQKMYCFDLLLSHGADINHRDNRGQTLVFEVINNWYGDSVKRLLDKKPDLTITDYSGQTPLFEMRTRSSSSPLNAKLMIEAGINVAHSNNKGQTFLHVVCSRGRDDGSDEFLVFVQWAFEHGLYINARDDTGRTPLLEAVQNRDEKLTLLLMQHGADPNAVDDQGWTPLSTVIDRDNSACSLELLSLLLENGADPRQPGPNGEGLLDMAVRLGKGELLGPLEAAMEERHIAQ